MRIAYIRVSSLDQNERRQIEAMERYNIEKWFIEKISAKDTNRPKLQELLEFAREGDIVHIHDFSRLARSTKDLLDIVELLHKKGVALVSNKENIDTTTPQGRFMLTVFGALAELERESILERQREGIEIAKGEGKYKGRKPVEFDEERFKTLCTRWRAGEITATAAMKELGLKPNTFYRRVKEMGL